MMQTLHTCNRLTWCGLNAPLNSDLGLPAYTPPTLQPAVLEYILLHCPDHQSMWAEEPQARVSCVLWMVDMMHFCLNHALQDGVDDSLKTHFYLEPCCLQFASFVPHLAVISEHTAGCACGKENCCFPPKEQVKIDDEASEHMGKKLVSPLPPPPAPQ